MAANRSDVFTGGLRLLLRNKRLLLWSYLLLLTAGLISGASLHGRIGPFLDHSLAAEKLAGSIDVGYYAELVQHVNQNNPGSGPVTSSLTLISVLLSFFLAAGTIFVYWTGEKPRLATVLRAGAEYFWRFFRLMLFFLLISGLILGPLGALRSLYLKHADEKYVEAAYNMRALLTIMVLLLIGVILRLWFDLAEVYVVRMGMEDDRRVRRSLVPSLRLLRANFVRVFASYFAAGTVGVLLFLLFTFFWASSQSSRLVLPVFLLSQLGVLSLCASRIWQRGIVTSLLSSVAEQEQTNIQEQTIVMVDPESPISDSSAAEKDFTAAGDRPLPPTDPIATADPLEGPAV